MMVLRSTARSLVRSASLSHAELLNWSAVLVWAVEFLNILTGQGVPVAILTVACLIYMVMVIPVVSRGAYFPILVALVGLAAFSLPMKAIDPTLQGLRFGTYLGAFLFSILLLRQVLLDLAPMARARERFANMVPEDQKGAAVLIASAFGSIFLMGVYALVAPLVRDHPPEERRAFGVVMIAGNALILLITPFSVGWTYANRMIPLPSVAPVFAGLVALWLIGVTVAIALHGRLRVSAVWGAIASVAPLAVPMALYGAILAVTCELTGLSVTGAVIAVTPLVYLVFYMFRSARKESGALQARMRDSYARAGRGLTEVLLYATSLACAIAVNESGVLARFFGALLAGYPPRTVLAAMALITPLVGLAGFHPSVPTALAALVGLAILPDSDSAITVLFVSVLW